MTRTYFIFCSHDLHFDIKFTKLLLAYRLVMFYINGMQSPERNSSNMPFHCRKNRENTGYGITKEKTAHKAFVVVTIIRTN